MKIHLVGPGGAGKSTVGVLLSDQLNTPFVDLDTCFRECAGDISDYLQDYGYQAYARKNVDVYLSIAIEDAVLAPSSGFMTYADEVHPSYAETRAAIAERSTTFLLLPSLDLETCVAEIVRRQVHRALGLVASREEAKIRERFTIYMALPAPKVTTLQPPDAVVAEIINVLQRGSTQHSSLDKLGAVSAHYLAVTSYDAHCFEWPSRGR
jgi:shikimate kinase